MKKLLLLIGCLFLIGCSSSDNDSTDYDPDGIAFKNTDMASGFERTSGTTGIIGDWKYFQEEDSSVGLHEVTMTLSFANGTFKFTRQFIYGGVLTISGTYNLYIKDNKYYICCNYGPYTDVEEYAVTDTDFSSYLPFVIESMYSNY